MGNKSYRIRTDVGKDKFLHVQLDQDYDILEILSLKIGQQQFYRLHTSNYGVIVGRVLANGGFGVPNAKVSLFISKNNNDDVISAFLYPYGQVTSTNEDGIRYNLLPSEKVTDCHNPVGTFPSKQYMLDNDSVLEVFEDYYRYTTKTNDAGDYMFVGVPVGSQTLHMDLDLSDCGVLSQRPYDFLYKGYNIEQFENANQFKTSKTLEELSQIFTQDQTVEVKPFWGDSNDDLQDIGITRADINVNFKFETSCVFLGSVFSDDADNGMSKRCLPRKKMGKMENLRTGEGTIEIIRKRTTYAEGESSVEEFQIKGTQLIDGDGTWCFQIPMNLDYMITDEYGNLVPTDNPEKGIATRTRVRFRISMNSDNSAAKYFQAKVLVPNNPQTIEDYQTTYIFGTETQDKYFKDLFWNNVYSVKSYIPRLQHANLLNNRSKRFTGIKTVNKPGSNNPFPYNHIRIQFPFYYTLICWLVKTVNAVVYIFNWFKTIWNHFLQQIYDIAIAKWHPFKFVKNLMFKSYTKVSGSFCPELSDRYFIPGAPVGNSGAHGGHEEVIDLYGNTLRDILREEYPNLTGVTSRNINVSTTTGSNGIWYPLQSGATLYGYYLLSKDNDGKYTGTVYLIGNFKKDATEQNKKYTNSSSLVKDCFYLGLALGEDTAAKNLADEYVFISKYSGNSQESLTQLKISYLYGWHFNQDSIVIMRYEASKKYYYYVSEGKTQYNDTIVESPETFFPNVKYHNTSFTVLRDVNKAHMPNGQIGNEFGVYTFVKNAVNAILDDLVLNYNGDFNSIEYKSSHIDTQIEEDNTEKICLHPKTDYLVSCIEYNLAEELDIINFDFYNDWINGAIYMPRWARTIKVRKINGKTKLRSCSDDANSSLKSLTITETSPIEYSEDHTVNVGTNLGWSTWQTRSRSNKLTAKLIHSEVYVTDKSVKVFYYVPTSFGTQRETILFATDIILLGSISECNIYGIPNNFDMYLDTTYQMPPDLATTNLAGDDGSAISLSDAGCVPLGEISSRSNSYIWEQYLSRNTSSNLNEGLTEESIPITEEAGVSWNKLGPNQLSSKPKIYDYLYNPGGHFLGLACMETLTQTTLKTNINLIRACEMGVSLSERHEEPYFMDKGILKNIYIAPNGLINKNDIYDVNGRALFATLNHNNLRTVVDTTTGYLRYDFTYLYPYGFGGEAADLIKRLDRTYNSEIAVKSTKKTSELSSDEKWETGHTYSRANDDISFDYKQYRLGTTYTYVGSSQLGRSSLFNVAGQTWNAINNVIQTILQTSTIPLFENSFYFYFGLHPNNTAIDKFRHSYQAVCAKKEIVKYRGELNVTQAYTDTTKEKIFAEIRIKDSVGPYTLTIENFNNQNEETFGIYLLNNTTSELEFKNAITNGILNNWTEIKTHLQAYPQETYENYDKDVFYILVDNDLKTKITVSSSKGDNYTRILGDGEANLDEYIIEAIPFSSNPREDSLDRTPTINYGVVTSITGGYIRTNYPVLDNEVFEFVFSNEKEDVMYKDYKDYVEKIETSSSTIYEIPVPSPSIYSVKLKRTKTGKVTGFKNIFVGCEKDENTVYLHNSYDDEMAIPNDWLESFDNTIDIEYVTDNLVQYGEPFTNSISLTTRMRHPANYDFIGQGEKYNKTNQTFSLDTGRTFSSSYEIDDIVFPSRIQDVTSGFSLSEANSYIPTRNYRATRRDFYVMYYDDYKVYSDPIVEVKITKCEHGNLTYNGGNPFNGNRVEIQWPNEYMGQFSTGQMFIIRGGDSTTGKEVFITWGMSIGNYSTGKDSGATLYTMDNIYSYIGQENLTIALFKPYTLPIYYVNEQLKGLTITLSNRFAKNKPFYKEDGLTTVDVEGWYDKNTKCLIDKSKLGCKIGNDTFNFKDLILSEEKQTFTSNLDVFDAAFFNDIELIGTQIGLRKDETETDISFGEFISDDKLNPNTEQTYTIESHNPRPSILSAKTKDERSELVLNYQDVCKEDDNSHKLCNSYTHITNNPQFKVDIREYPNNSTGYDFVIDPYWDNKMLVAKGYRICVGLGNIEIGDKSITFEVSYDDSLRKYHIPGDNDDYTPNLFPYISTDDTKYVSLSLSQFSEMQRNNLTVTLDSSTISNSGFCFTFLIPCDADYYNRLSFNEVLNALQVSIKNVEINGEAANSGSIQTILYWINSSKDVCTIDYKDRLMGYYIGASSNLYDEENLGDYTKITDDESNDWVQLNKSLL